MANYILVCTDGTTPELDHLPARAVAASRLEARRWPLYQRTRHRREIVAGDRVAVYVGGKERDAQVFVATATVDSVSVPVVARNRQVMDEQKQEAVASWLELGVPAALLPPVKMRIVLAKLSFAPLNRTQWGVVIMGGVRRISDRDWSVIAGE